MYKINNKNNYSFLITTTAIVEQKLSSEATWQETQLKGQWKCPVKIWTSREKMNNQELNLLGVFTHKGIATLTKGKSITIDSSLLYSEQGESSLILPVSLNISFSSEENIDLNIIPNEDISVCIAGVHTPAIFPKAYTISSQKTVGHVRSLAYVLKTKELGAFNFSEDRKQKSDITTEKKTFTFKSLSGKFDFKVNLEVNKLKSEKEVCFLTWVDVFKLYEGQPMPLISSPQTSFSIDLSSISKGETRISYPEDLTTTEKDGRVFFRIPLGENPVFTGRGSNNDLFGNLYFSLKIKEDSLEVLFFNEGFKFYDKATNNLEEYKGSKEAFYTFK
jgi:hypothetical protein